MTAWRFSESLLYGSRRPLRTGLSSLSLSKKSSPTSTDSERQVDWGSRPGLRLAGSRWNRDKHSDTDTVSGRRSKLPGPAAWARPRAGPGPVGVRTQLEHGRGTAVPPPGRGEAAARFTGHMIPPAVAAVTVPGPGSCRRVKMIAAAGPLRDSDAGVPATVPVTRDSDCKTVRSDSAWAADGHGHRRSDSFESVARKVSLRLAS